jgi:4-alpha-glucanotransferase
MTFARASGILLHPTSLPSRGGIGDLGPAAHEFIQFLADAKQSLWQVLPLNPVGYGYSPYSATSAFAGNPLLISVERLADWGWLDAAELDHLASDSGKVDYRNVILHKYPLLRRAARNFLRQSSGPATDDWESFQEFCRKNAAWLEDYVLFESLRERFHYRSWNEWPRELSAREPSALEKARTELAHHIEVSRVLQWAFHRQWSDLHERCRQRGIRIVGDVALFISFDSADGWTHPELFHLDETFQPRFVAGVPPDAFSDTGQRWGNPLYRWDLLQQDGYSWWVERMRAALKTCDFLRLDHFRGFEQYWEIPASESTAVNGRWVDGPRDELFQVLKERLGELPFIAEDLGLITPEVEALRCRLEVPGMKVLQFAFSDRGAHIYLPHRYGKNYVVYTGTHDNDTTVGWWNSLNGAERRNIEAYFGPAGCQEINWAMIRAAQASVANFAIIPLQDVLGAGSEARMNTPSRSDQNWAWRYRPGDLRPELAQRLAQITEVTDRDLAFQS